MMFRPLPVMTVLTVVSLVILVLLGNWQYARYSEKINEDPDDLPPVQSLTFDVISPGEGALAQQVYGVADSEPLWRRYVLAERRDTGAQVILALNATGGPRPVSLALTDIGEVRADVRVFPREGRESGRNAPPDEEWYVYDRAGMLSQWGLEDSAIDVAEPLELTVIDAANTERTRTTANPYAAPRPVDPLPPQRHFGYAITWWGLAAVLFVMYFVFHASRGRLSLRG